MDLLHDIVEVPIDFAFGAVTFWLCMVAAFLLVFDISEFKSKIALAATILVGLKWSIGLTNFVAKLAGITLVNEVVMARLCA